MTSRIAMDPESVGARYRHEQRKRAVVADNVARAVK